MGESFVERLKAEREELFERRQKLEAFLEKKKLSISGIIDVLPEQFALLNMQNEVMRMYLSILDRRLELLGVD